MCTRLQLGCTGIVLAPKVGLFDREPAVLMDELDGERRSWLRRLGERERDRRGERDRCGRSLRRRESRERDRRELWRSREQFRRFRETERDRRLEGGERSLERTLDFTDPSESLLS